jgi:hypothetical protein
VVENEAMKMAAAMPIAIAAAAPERQAVIAPGSRLPARGQAVGQVQKNNGNTADICPS